MEQELLKLARAEFEEEIAGEDIEPAITDLIGALFDRIEALYDSLSNRDLQLEIMSYRIRTGISLGEGS